MRTMMGSVRSGMNTRGSLWSIIPVLLIIMATNVPGTTFYVDASRPDDSGDGLSWATAKQTIQAGVDAASGEEALILVTNGVYHTGSGTESSVFNPGGIGWTVTHNNWRVLVDGPITIQSENGPDATIIDASGSGSNALAGVKMTSGSSLIGFTVMNARWSQAISYDYAGCRNVNQSSGMGIEANGGVIKNCIVKNNNGGGISGGTIWNSAIIGNSGYYGGGVSGGTLYNCTVVGNSASGFGGGIYCGILNNCIVWGNTCASNPASANYIDATINYSCSTPLPSGTGNISLNPGLVDDWRITAVSSCAAAGSFACCSGTDIDGDAWKNPPSIGCDEIGGSSSLTGQFTVAISAEGSAAFIDGELTFSSAVSGEVTSNEWNFGDGTFCINEQTVTHSWQTSGVYEVMLTVYNSNHTEGVSDTLCVTITEPGRADYYVDILRPDDSGDGLSWATAKRSIQAAVDAAGGMESLILVNSGLYDIGSRVQDSVENRVHVIGPITIQSATGPENTIIDAGACWDSASPIKKRGVYMADGAVLSGFTVYRGYVTAYGSAILADDSCVISNCIITENSADGDNGCVKGGMVYNTLFTENHGNCSYSGTLYGCIFTNNEGRAGFYSVLDRCILENNGSVSAVYGGGARYCTINNSVIRNNTAPFGGGVFRCIVRNSLLAGNTAITDQGGGAYDSELWNCTVIGNNGYGVYMGTLNNCILWGNSVTNDYSDTTLNYCCTYPMTTNGVGNISVDPEFVNGYHLGLNSPCIGAGSAVYASGVDIDGETWKNPPSIGCDEYVGLVVPEALSVSIHVDQTTVTAGMPILFTAEIVGNATSNRWSFTPYYSIAPDTLCFTTRWTAVGTHDVVLTVYNDEYPSGVSATQRVTILPGTFYVWADSPSPTAPYTDWETAAHNIQQAVNMVADGDEAKIWVRSGTYNTGGIVSDGDMAGYQASRVCVDGPITIQSESGPETTLISGFPKITYLSTAVDTRCVWLKNGARFIGFTVSGGSCGSSSGGGIRADDSCIISNCNVNSNSAYSGGGVAGGILYNCVISGNWARTGGGADGGALYNCLLNDNSADEGGGAYGLSLIKYPYIPPRPLLVNCTVVGNRASIIAGGVYGGKIENSIVWGNTMSSNNAASEYAENGFYDSCTSPLPTNGADNVASDPLFVDAAGGDYRLQAGSPCYNAGNNAYLPSGMTNDLAGNPRIYGGQVDMGAYERQIEQTYFTITVHVGPHGRVLPAGDTFLVESNASLSLRFVPDEWYEIDDINVNGISIHDDAEPFFWDDITAAGTVDVTFVEMCVSNNPILQGWMNRNGITNGIPHQGDQDGDGLSAWQEYVMDTDPMDPCSALILDAKPGGYGAPVRGGESETQHILRWQASADRYYTIYSSTNLFDGFTMVVLEGCRPAESGAISYTNEVEDTSGAIYYRIKVALP